MFAINSAWQLRMMAGLVVTIVAALFPRHCENPFLVEGKGREQFQACEGIVRVAMG